MTESKVRLHTERVAADRVFLEYNFRTSKYMITTESNEFNKAVSHDISAITDYGDAIRRYAEVVNGLRRSYSLATRPIYYERAHLIRSKRIYRHATVDLWFVPCWNQYFVMIDVTQELSGIERSKTVVCSRELTAQICFGEQVEALETTVRVATWRKLEDLFESVRENLDGDAQLNALKLQLIREELDVLMIEGMGNDADNSGNQTKEKQDIS